jgi:hypothetical protein
MEKQENKTTNYSPDYLDNIASAYVFYKDWELAKDIARIRPSSVNYPYPKGIGASKEA